MIYTNSSLVKRLFNLASVQLFSIFLSIAIMLSETSITAMTEMHCFIAVCLFVALCDFWL